MRVLAFFTLFVVGVFSFKLENVPIHDPCGNIQCGELQCPTGFHQEQPEGHCCPYCVNPDIKLEDKVVGVTGDFGGKPSTFCADVHCFPTMCTGTLTSPTGTNGKCCPTCAA